MDSCILAIPDGTRSYVVVRVRGNIIGHARNNMYVNLGHSLRPQGVDFAKQNRRPARWAISINHAGCDRENVVLFFFVFFGSS